MDIVITFRFNVSNTSRASTKITHIHEAGPAQFVSHQVKLPCKSTLYCIFFIYFNGGYNGGREGRVNVEESANSV